MSAFSRLFKTVFGLQLEAELLEGDNIDIDYAHIKTVRGNNVTVGPNCEIELIEYTGVLTVDKSANVKEIKQVWQSLEKGERGIGMENQHSLTVNGSGSSAGGDYNKVKIRGEGTISNHMSCNDFKTYGTSEVRGNMKAKNYVVYGDSEVQGNMEAEYVKVYGNAQVQGDGQINKTKVRGMIEFKGKLSGDFIDVKGALNVKGDIELEELLLTGGLESDGLLNAENIEISLRYEGSKVREIGGKKITVRKKARFIPFTSHAGTTTSRSFLKCIVSLTERFGTNFAPPTIFCVTGAGAAAKAGTAIAGDRRHDHSESYTRVLAS